MSLSLETNLTEGQQKFLLGLARQAITYYLEKEKTIEAKTEEEALKEKRGVFVTLKLRDQLRGCIGYSWPHKPLCEAVIDSAISAATRDFRFDPVTLEEMLEIKIEISALALPKPVTDIAEIEVGKHGIIVSKGLNKGLLLPQVPLEWNWDLETFLRHGCLKAGLAENEWKKGAQIEIFTAQIFAE